MKRSAINEILNHTHQSFSQHGMHLPPSTSLPPVQWRKFDATVRSEVFDLRLDWDVTVFGGNSFATQGLVLFTLRNDSSKGMPYEKCYAEKITRVRDAQAIPIHFHQYKREDIINRGGSNLIVELWSVEIREQAEEAGISVVIDGCRQTRAADSQLRLAPGENICLPPGLYHSFWTEEGFGDVLAGEVSSVNGNDRDGHFLQPIVCYSDIEKDEPAQLVLCNEYRLFR